MEIIVIAIVFLYLVWMVIEKKKVKQMRQTFKHVIHVHGTRGKSTVARMIGTMLRLQGHRVMTKVTGTIPMIIDPDGHQHVIKRLGPAHIREQLRIMRKAYQANVDILVIECMAIQDDLVKVTQRDMLDADMVVITNVRPDHGESHQTDLVETLLDAINQPTTLVVSEALARSHPLDALPEWIRLVIADEVEEAGIDPYAANIGLTLAVGAEFGIAKQEALAAIKDYPKDVGALSAYRFDQRIIINAFSINDVISLQQTFEHLNKQSWFTHQPCSVLIHNRLDRPHRALSHLTWLMRVRPQKVWLSGPFFHLFRRRLVDSEVFRYGTLSDIDDPLVLAMGNIKGVGTDIIGQLVAKGEKIHG